LSERTINLDKKLSERTIFWQILHGQGQK